VLRLPRRDEPTRQERVCETANYMIAVLIMLKKIRKEAVAITWRFAMVHMPPLARLAIAASKVPVTMQLTASINTTV
jgi:hypothetical protein